MRRSLGVGSLGINLVELGPGESAPEHDESDRDHEEVFAVLQGTPTIEIDGEEHALEEGSFARLDPHLRRGVKNHGEEPARVLIVSAPRSSGYEPLAWA